MTIEQVLPNKKGHHTIEILNVYIPWDPHHPYVKELYNILNSEFKSNRKNKFVCGDFNASLSSYENINNYPKNVGPFGKYHKNLNQLPLINFLTLNELYATNTFFKHKLAHVTTFQQYSQPKNKVNPIRKQLDYVLAPFSWKINNTNSRSYSGTLTKSDHRLVKCTFKINWLKVYKAKTVNNKNITVNHLRNNTTAKVYNDNVKDKLNDKKSNSNQEKWDILCNTLIETSENLKPNKYKSNINFNENINSLSVEQKKLRLKINKEKIIFRRSHLKESRNKLLKEIKYIQQQEKENKLNCIINEINESKNDSRRMFKAIKEINRKTENEIIVNDVNGNFIGNNTTKIEIISKHFIEVFQNKNAIYLPKAKCEK